MVYSVYRIKETELKFTYDWRDNSVMDSFLNWLHRGNRIDWDKDYYSISEDEIEKEPDVIFIPKL